MPEQDDIVLVLRIGLDDTIDAKLLLEALDSVESALYDSDRRDVEMASRELGLSSVVRDASLERLRHHRHKRLLIREARSGSIELVAVVAAVSLYVIDKTLGEALKDGFRDSNLYGAVREVFRAQLDRKAVFLAESLRRAFAGRKRQVAVRSDPSSPGEPRVIRIDVLSIGQPAAERPVRSLGEELRQ